MECLLPNMRHRLFNGICTLMLFLALALVRPTSPQATEAELNRYKGSFKNFVICELTRTSAKNHFKGKSFKITMIDLFEITRESGLIIITGAIQCYVKDKYQMLYAAVGIETIMDTEQVSFYTIRNKDFTILATELMKYPYKERCPWTEYWIDTD